MSLIWLLTSVLLARPVAAYSYEVCCDTANHAGALLSMRNVTLYALSTNEYRECGQEYGPNKAPAVDVYVLYQWCTANCGGFAIAKVKEPSKWAAPLVQFILPSIIFSMSIPRRRLFVWMPAWKALEGTTTSIWAALGSVVYGLALSISAALDTLIWVAIILTTAGPLVVSGLVEALLDCRILRVISPDRQSNLDRNSKLRLLVAVVCGNLLLPSREEEDAVEPLLRGQLPLQPGDLVALLAMEMARPDNQIGNDRHRAVVQADRNVVNPPSEVFDALVHLDRAGVRAVLLNLMSAQGDFGALVGAPVVFYLGAFVYTILEQLDDPSKQDAAISLAFGVKWMMIVHVSIISGCLLASNNPSAASVLAAKWPALVSSRLTRALTMWSTIVSNRPTVFKTRFQPVSMIIRGSNKEEWLYETVRCGSHAEQSKALLAAKKEIDIGFWGYCGWVLVPAVVLVSLPPAAGGVVAWQTPPVGWGCRSLTLVLYAGCQFLMIVEQLRQRYYRFAWRPQIGTRLVSILHRMCYVGATAYHLFLLLVSLFLAIGGTLMQIMGVYGNCFCYVNAPVWLHLNDAHVNVASDIQDQRHSSRNWIIVGSVATGFMALYAYIGWWYQKMIRTEYRRCVESL